MALTDALTVTDRAVKDPEPAECQPTRRGGGAMGRARRRDPDTTKQDDRTQLTADLKQAMRDTEDAARRAKEETNPLARKQALAKAVHLASQVMSYADDLRREAVRQRYLKKLKRWERAWVALEKKHPSGDGVGPEPSEERVTPANGENARVVGDREAERGEI